MNEAELAEKGYLVDPAEEQRRYEAAYRAFLEGRATDEVQLFYVPSYACNFGCSYCFQDEYAPAKGHDPDAVLDAFFSYVDDTFATRRKYVTLFGGEPLLDTPTEPSHGRAHGGGHPGPRARSRGGDERLRPGQRRPAACPRAGSARCR